MRAVSMVQVAVVVLGAGSALPVFAADVDRLLGHSRAEVEAAFPNLPKDQLDMLIYRIPTFQQTMGHADPVFADAVDPNENLGLSPSATASGVYRLRGRPGSSPEAENEHHDYFIAFLERHLC
jgi:hypothetical protein